MQSQIQLLGSLTNDSVESISKQLALKIKQNQALNDALHAHGKTQPRFLGVLALGIAQIVTEVVTIGLTRNN